MSQLQAETPFQSKLSTPITPVNGVMFTPQSPHQYRSNDRLINQYMADIVED